MWKHKTQKKNPYEHGQKKNVLIIDPQNRIHKIKSLLDLITVKNITLWKTSFKNTKIKYSFWSNEIKLNVITKWLWNLKYLETSIKHRYSF